MKRIRIAIVGLGKIARDAHVPSIAHNSAFELVAIASPHSKLEGVPSFASIEAMLQAVPGIDAVALCTTPQVRYDVARYALEQGRHVLLEKPPGATLSEVSALVELATKRGVVLFASWHSRHAAAVEPARAWLAGRKIHSVSVAWKEDVRVWHPGQPWIWKAGGLGVFDPGINAFSILTHILPGPLVVKDAELSYPSNCDTPIAARLILQGPQGLPVHIEFDFRQTGPQNWDIDIQTDGGRLFLSKGGSVMRAGDAPEVAPGVAEYASLYAHFASLIRERRVDVDLSPFQLVADALLCGRRINVEPFVE